MSEKDYVKGQRNLAVSLMEELGKYLPKCDLRDKTFLQEELNSTRNELRNLINKLGLEDFDDEFHLADAVRHIEKQLDVIQ